VQQSDSTSLLNWYKKLINIRNNNAPLRLGEYETVQTSHSSVMAFLRHYKDEKILVIINTASRSVGLESLSFLGRTIEPGSYYLHNLVSGSDSITVAVDDSYRIQDLDIGAYGTRIFKFFNDPGTQIENTDMVISGFRLAQNYPNPFNPVTNITYSIIKPAQVTLEIYNMLGEKVETLVNKYQNPGSFNIKFNASS